MKYIAYLVFYIHLCFMGFIFFGKLFTPPGVIDGIIVLTIVSQIIFSICPLTTLEEYLFKQAQIPYTYKSWTKWIYLHFGALGPLLTLLILWEISETMYLVLSNVLNMEYSNFVVSGIFIFF